MNKEAYFERAKVYYDVLKDSPELFEQAYEAFKKDASFAVNYAQTLNGACDGVNGNIKNDLSFVLGAFKKMDSDPDWLKKALTLEKHDFVTYANLVGSCYYDGLDNKTRRRLLCFDKIIGISCEEDCLGM